MTGQRPTKNPTRTPGTSEGSPFVVMLQALREVAGDCFVLDPVERSKEDDTPHCRFCDHAQGKPHDPDCTMHVVLDAIAKAEAAS